MQEQKSLTEYKLALCDRILDAALHTFAERGVKGTKMDDVAAQLGISKRTLYEIYNTKETLLFESIRRLHRQKSIALNAFANDPKHDVVDIIVYLYRQQIKQTVKVSPGFYEEIAIYPRIESYLAEQRQRNNEAFLKFISRGISEGFFLREIDYKIVAQLFESIGRYISNRRLYEQYSFEQLFFNMLFIPLRGFCTKKGIEKLDAFFRENKV